MILSTQAAPGAPHFVFATQPGAAEVEAVNGKTERLCLPGAGGGTMWMPESPGWSRPL
jgi:hypothetical protein